MTNKINSIKPLTLLLLSTIICAELFASEVNVYSGRKEKLIKPLLDEFSKETGVKVNLVTAKSSALLKRLELEAQSSPADIFITVDVGRLHHAKKIGLFQKIDKESLVNVKEAYLDKEGYWVGLSKRVRTIVVDKKITESEIKSFKDLTSGKFQNEICIRSSNNIYNQSMVASFIYHFGEKKTEKLMKKFVNNFARKPSGNDRAQIYSILKGECSIAVVNHYYYARLVKSNEEKDKDIPNKTKIIFLDQSDIGSHVNLSGVGIIKSSKNIKNANLLISFLLQKESQAWYAKVNNEYPVIEAAENNKILDSWGYVKMDIESVSSLGELNAAAIKLMDRVGWQ